MKNSNSQGILVQVINLERRPDRLSRISTELQRAGLSFETQVAVDGRKLGFDPKFLSRGEVGCFQSHINSMLRQNEVGAQYSLILEDDAILSPVVNDKFLSEMIELMKRNKIDILQIGFSEWLYSMAFSLKSGVLEFLIGLLKGRGTLDSTGLRFVLGEFRAGTFGYIINSRVAEAISESVPYPPLTPLDGYFSSLASGQLGRPGGIRIARLVTSEISHSSSRDDSDL
jgi:GR25 family glycosyltransferase involved in LPS biosynthesis